MMVTEYRSSFFLGTQRCHTISLTPKHRRGVTLQRNIFISREETRQTSMKNTIYQRESTHKNYKVMNEQAAFRMVQKSSPVFQGGGKVRHPLDTFGAIENSDQHKIAADEVKSLHDSNMPTGRGDIGGFQGSQINQLPIASGSSSATTRPT